MVEFGADVLLIVLVDEFGVGLEQGYDGQDEFVVPVDVLHAVFNLQQQPL
jgi:hypothetical protein